MQCHISCCGSAQPAFSSHSRAVWLCTGSLPHQQFRGQLDHLLTICFSVSALTFVFLQLSMAKGNRFLKGGGVQLLDGKNIIIKTLLQNKTFHGVNTADALTLIYPPVVDPCSRSPTNTTPGAMHSSLYWMA